MKVYGYIMELGFVHKTSSVFIKDMGDYIDTVRKHGL